MANASRMLKTISVDSTVIRIQGIELFRDVVEDLSGTPVRDRVHVVLVHRAQGQDLLAPTG